MIDETVRTISKLVQKSPMTIMLISTSQKWDLLSHVIPNTRVYSGKSKSLITQLSSRCSSVKKLEALDLAKCPSGTIVICDVSVNKERILIDGTPLATEAMSIMTHRNVSALYIILPFAAVRLVGSSLGQVTCSQINEKTALLVKRTAGYTITIAPVDPESSSNLAQSMKKTATVSSDEYDPESNSELPVRLATIRKTITELTENPLFNKRARVGLHVASAEKTGLGVAINVASQFIGIRKASVSYYDAIAADAGLQLVLHRDQTFANFKTRVYAAYRYFATAQFGLSHQILSNGLIQRNLLHVAPDLANPPIASLAKIRQLHFLQACLRADQTPLEIVSTETGGVYHVTLKWPWADNTFVGTHQTCAGAEEVAAAKALENLKWEETVKQTFYQLTRVLQSTGKSEELWNRFPPDEDELVLVFRVLPGVVHCWELLWCTEYDTRSVFVIRSKSLADFIDRAINSKSSWSWDE